MTTYKVTAETYAWRECSTCKGAGHKSRTFQGHTFKEVCVMCGGSRREKITHRTEVTLQEALEKLGLNETIIFNVF